MYCTHCGRTLRSEFDNFCAHCGEATVRYDATRQGAPRRLYRLAYDRAIAGVCSGLAKYLDVDVNLVRLAVILVTIFTGGLAGFGYIAAWILIPVERIAPAAPQPAPVSSQTPV